jgi:hypothetical protein
MSRFHRIGHWTGAAIAVPLLVLAAWAAAQGAQETDLDERNAMFGVAMFAPAAAVAAYGLARAVGWFLAELFD